MLFLSTVLPRAVFAAAGNRGAGPESPSLSSPSNPPCVQYVQGNFRFFCYFLVHFFFFFFFFFEAASTSCEHPDERYTVKIKPLKRLKGHFRFGPVRLQDNLWALEWFWDFLACGSGRLSSFSQEVTEELEHSAGERVEMFRYSY